MQIHRIGDVTVLNDFAPVPGFGGAPPLFLPVNAFVLHAEEPVVIDTGLSTADKDFVSALAAVLDPADVRWIWITHPDRDHTGGLWKLLHAAPQARLVTTFLGIGIMPPNGPCQSGPGPQRRRSPPALLPPATVRQSLHHRLPRRSDRCAVQLRLLRRTHADT